MTIAQLATVLILALGGIVGGLSSLARAEEVLDLTPNDSFVWQDGRLHIAPPAPSTTTTVAAAPPAATGSAPASAHGIRLFFFRPQSKLQAGPPVSVRSKKVTPPAAAVTDKDVPRRRAIPPSETAAKNPAQKPTPLGRNTAAPAATATTTQVTTAPAAVAAPVTRSPAEDAEVYGGLALIRCKIDKSYELATRGALYSARAGLLEALRLLADHLDAAEGSSERRKALTSALQCLDEAEDFTSFGRVAGDVDVAQIAAAHRTLLAKSLPPQPTAAQALALYHAYAINEFGRAFASCREASPAMSGLGKLEVRMGSAQVPRVANVSGKAMVFQRAALKIDENNWLAANELGVLLASCGQSSEAAWWLRHSARLSQRPEAWRNLWVVSQQMGNTQLAEEAKQHLARQDRQGAPSPRPAVQWVSPATMAGRQHALQR